MNEERILKKVLKYSSQMSVYEVFDRELNRECIVKEALKENNDLFVRQLKMESRVLGRIQSKWIPKLYLLEEQGQYVRIVEEKMNGILLQDWLKTNPSSQKKKKIFIQILHLLEKVHESGFLYLDLKADNIMIVQNHACLIDFNSVLSIGGRQIVMANKDSLPPEADKGYPLDERADQIGLGKLYEKMFGAGHISWICLQEDPGKRFSSLDSLEAMMQPWIRFTGLRAAAAASLCLVVFSAAILDLNSFSMESADLDKEISAQTKSGAKAFEGDGQALCELFSRNYDVQIFVEDPELLAQAALIALENSNAYAGRQIMLYCQNQEDARFEILHNLLKYSFSKEEQKIIMAKKIMSEVSDLMVLSEGESALRVATKVLSAQDPWDASGLPDMEELNDKTQLEGRTPDFAVKEITMDDVMAEKILEMLLGIKESFTEEEALFLIDDLLGMKYITGRTLEIPDPLIEALSASQKGRQYLSMYMKSKNDEPLFQQKEETV